ncbi:Uncharacterised protein [Streptococcus pneumoniae]|nr:Uncharacterised protein [Streptococcus pneumoniae]CJC43234.1 Uncharacterised protein [Streptococcus pneumoniae]CJH67638.1 Uncharacterised protein [Streptococcus pneumoniae]CJH90542.1 Uncharacterised protein [Streptococcus pneumoniae]
MVNDLTMRVSLMDFLNTTISSCCCKNLNTPKNMIKNVVNLIPPPVEALPAPINIRSIINRREGFDNVEISTVLNPAVRVEIA